MPPPNNRFDLLRDTLARRLASWQGARLAVAVSGGVDSVAMLRLLHELAPRLNLALVVAHLNHGLRGAEADADAAFVADLAQSLDLPCEIGHWKPERSAHFEADARRARYAWLAEVAARQNAPLLAVAHTRDDQAETILLNILRGTGIRGLAGMPASRLLNGNVRLIRPLLDQSRETLRAYLDEHNQPHRDDPTNADPTYTRSRIRHELIPLLESRYNPRATDALLRLGSLARATNNTLRKRLESAARPLAVNESALEITFDAAKLARLPRILRAEALRHIWRCLDWPQRDMSRAQWNRLARLAAAPDSAPARIQLPGSIEAQRRGTLLLLRLVQPPSLDPPPTWPPLSVPIPGAAQGEPGTITLSHDPEPKRGQSPFFETIDAEALEPFRDSKGRPFLVLRVPQPGDRFAPLGMHNHAKPLTDFLRERRVPLAKRPTTPLLCDARGILWVVGHRIADRVRRKDTTRQTLNLRFEPPA